MVDNMLTEEERHFAIHGHYPEFAPIPGRDRGIWCYTDRMSYTPGERVRFHVCGSAETCTLKVERDGGSRTIVHEQSRIPCRMHDSPEDSFARGCGWPVAWELEIPREWPSGAYIVTVNTEERDGSSFEAQHIFIVRPEGNTDDEAVLLVAATSTWIAYNEWGGANHYEGRLGPTEDQFSPRLSTARPWTRGTVDLPPHAPRVPLFHPPPIGAPVRYPHMEWALRNGYGKKYASSGWAAYERHFVRWAENEGYRVDVASQHDLHYHPQILSDYRCVVFVGHDEYWSWEMRDAVDQYVENGGHVARFAGNFMWQIRLEDEGGTQVCYKYRARAEDPAFGDPQHHCRTTTAWEDPEIGRPGAATFGLNATRGLYTHWGGATPRGCRGFPIYRPEHWAFSGTGFCYGDVLGADGGVFGYEVDGLDYSVEDGIPHPRYPEEVPDGLEIIAMGMSTLAEDRTSPAGGDYFMGDDDLDFVASLMSGTEHGRSRDSLRRGSGMIVNFPRGRGEVFHAGTCEWVAGLMREDPGAMQVTRNVLNRYLGRWGT